MKQLKRYINEWRLNDTSKSNVDTKTKKDLIAEIKARLKNNSTELDLSDIDVTNLHDISELFNDDCYKNIKKINVTGWNTKHITDMSFLFKDCENLKEIKGIENWDVRNVKHMNSMFRECHSLKCLNLSKWNTDSVEYTRMMFYGCHNLKEIKGVENWNIKNIKHPYNMGHMFDYTKITPPSWYKP